MYLSARLLMTLQPSVGPWLLLEYPDLSLDGGSACRKAATCTQTSVDVGFEPTIPVFERTNTVHALERSATVIGPHFTYTHQNIINSHTIEAIH
jgi:hypothetical protein